WLASSRTNRKHHSCPTRRSSDLDEEQPARAVEQQEAQVAPAVPPGAQVRRAGAAVGRQGGGHLAHVETLQRGLHDHLAGELHATDRKSTRLNSSHVKISYAVFCL